MTRRNLIHISNFENITVSSDIKKIDEETIVKKGTPTLDDVHGEIDLYEQDQGSYHRQKVYKALQKLKKHTTTPISKLDKNTLKDFYYILDVEKKLKNNKQNKNLFLSDVKKIFGDCEETTPGTVGAFLVQCQNAFECDPSCINNIDFNDNKNNQCTHVSIYYSHKEKKFKSLNNVFASDHCYIWINCKKNEFEGFSENDMEVLKTYKCNKYILSYSDVKNHELKYELSDLPMKNNQNNNKSPLDLGAINNASGDLNQNRIMLSLVGLIIIIALICLAYFYLKYSQISDENRYYYEDF